MTWHGPTTPRDPLLGTYTWRVRHRKHWRRLRLPCSICHRPIDYDGPRFIPGTRKLNPRGLVIGHIVSRYQAKRMGWPESAVNALSNTQPECVECSSKSGGRLGNRVQRTSRRVRIGRSDRDRW